MEYFVPILLILVGMLGLYYGADWLVEGASHLAIRLGIKPLIVGLVVVSFGTSSPELFTSLIAQLSLGSGNVAVANVIGSNIYNIGLVLGAAAFLQPLVVHVDIIRREAPLNIAVALLLFLAMWDGEVSRIEGLGLVTGFVLYLSYHVYLAKKENKKDLFLKELNDRNEVKHDWSLRRSLVYVIGGSACLGLAAWAMVGGAIDVARFFAISERVIGLTAVAIGTSLPELITTIVAAAKKQSDIAVGNVVGSNIFNILLVVGSVAAIRSIGFDDKLFQIDAPFMIGFSALMAFFIGTRRRVVRWEGAVLISFSLGYTAYLFIST
jgi:cation:H+ antiporter